MTASNGLSFAVIATMTTGKTSRMPKTAMSTPTVRKIFCQKAFIFCRIPALTTALSKESEISRTDRIATMASPVPPPEDAGQGQAGAVMPNDQPKVLQKHWLPTHPVTWTPPRRVAALRNVDPEV